MANICLAMPLRDEQTYLSTAKAYATRASEKHQVFPIDVSTSILTYGFNILWVAMLNFRKEHELDYFVMLHNDIAPIDLGWADILIDEMEAHSADAICAVSPLKNMRGLTSIAIELENPWRPRKLTLHEIFQLPETFSIKDTQWPNSRLLLNTGCMAVKLGDWVEKKKLLTNELDLRFHFKDRIIYDGQKYLAETMSEDWNFARDLDELGKKCVATRKVKLEHVGHHRFPNYYVWGECETDPAHVDTIP